MVECWERDRLILWDVVLPTPREAADPFERQGPYGRLMGCAHFTNVWRRHCGHWRRQWTHDCFPLRAGTGASPAYFCRSAAVPERARCSPQATSRRGATTGPAPGMAGKRGKSAGRWARCALAVSKSALACKVTRRGATRAWTNRALGALTPSSVVHGVAALRAWRRGEMTSAERTGWSRKQGSRVGRRARGGRFAGGPATQKGTENVRHFLLNPV